MRPASGRRPTPYPLRFHAWRGVTGDSERTSVRGRSPEGNDGQERGARNDEADAGAKQGGQSLRPVSIATQSLELNRVRLDPVHHEIGDIRSAVIAEHARPA